MFAVNYCTAQVDTAEVKYEPLGDTRYNTSDFEIYYKSFSRTKIIRNKDTVYVSKTNILSEYNNTLMLSGNLILIPGAKEKIALSSLHKMIFYTGRNGWTGAGIGLGVGVVSAMVISGMTLEGESRLGILFYVPMGGLLGAIAGGFIGSQIYNYDEYNFEKMGEEIRRKELMRLMLKYKN